MRGLNSTNGCTWSDVDTLLHSAEFQPQWEKSFGGGVRGGGELQFIAARLEQVLKEAKVTKWEGMHRMDYDGGEHVDAETQQYAARAMAMLVPQPSEVTAPVPTPQAEPVMEEAMA